MQQKIKIVCLLNDANGWTAFDTEEKPVAPQGRFKSYTFTINGENIQSITLDNNIRSLYAKRDKRIGKAGETVTINGTIFTIGGPWRLDVADTHLKALIALLEDAFESA